MMRGWLRVCRSESDQSNPEPSSFLLLRKELVSKGLPRRPSTCDLSVKLGPSVFRALPCDCLACGCVWDVSCAICGRTSRWTRSRQSRVLDVCVCPRPSPLQGRMFASFTTLLDRGRWCVVNPPFRHGLILQLMQPVHRQSDGG